MRKRRSGAVTLGIGTLGTSHSSTTVRIELMTVFGSLEWHRRIRRKGADSWVAIPAIGTDVLPAGAGCATGLSYMRTELELKQLGLLVGALWFVQGLWILLNQLSAPLPFEIFVGIIAIGAGFALAKRWVLSFIPAVAIMLFSGLPAAIFLTKSPPEWGMHALMAAMSVTATLGTAVLLIADLASRTLARRHR